MGREGEDRRWDDHGDDVSGAGLSTGGCGDLKESHCLPLIKTVILVKEVVSTIDTTSYFLFIRALIDPLINE